MLSVLASCIGVVFRYREILFQSTIAQVRQRYAGSLVGIFWLLLSPCILLTFYSVVYVVVLRVQPSSLTQGEYVLYMLAGLVPFLGFSESLSSGSSSLLLNREILLNTVFPSELVPFRAVLASQTTAAVGLTLTLLVAFIFGKLSWSVLLVPVIWLLLVLFLMGIVWILSILSLVFRDIQHAMGFVSTALLIITPIAYTPEMVPKSLELLIYLNPLSYFVIGFHEVIVFGQLPSPPVLAGITVLGLASWATGYWVFCRMRRVFFDYA